MKQNKSNKIERENKLVKIFWIILTIFLAIAFIIAGYMRITNFGKEEIDIGKVINGVIIVVLFSISLYLENLLKRGYYLTSAESSIGKFLFMPIIFPKNYFNKQNLWKGYLFYFLSRVFFILFIILFIISINLQK